MGRSATRASKRQRAPETAATGSAPGTSGSTGSSKAKLVPAPMQKDRRKLAEYQITWC